MASLEALSRPRRVWAATDGRGLVGLDGCEVRLCDPCARVRPCVPCVPAPPGVFLPVPGFGCRVVVPKSQPRTGVRVCRWVWMVVRFVCVLRVSAYARLCVPCVSPLCPGSPGVFYRYRYRYPYRSIRMLMKSLVQVIAKWPAHGALRRLSISAMPYTNLEPVDVLAPATRVLRMQRPPVNSLSLEVLSSFAESLAEAESDPACRAVVLASASPTVFCAGLDITEMHEPKPERLHQFWHTLQEVWIKLSTSRVATIAAIEGHSPAGGCMLAMSCDWRVMALADPIKGKPLTIGLNETKLGIVAPFWFADTMEYVVGARQTDLLLQTGALLTTEEALAVGLIDEAVAHDQVMSRAAVKTKEFLSVPDSARHASKMLLRAPMAERLLASRQEDNASFSAFCLTPAVQASLGKYMAALKQKKSK